MNESSEVGPRPRPRKHALPTPLDRRRFIVLLGGAALYTALRPHHAWARTFGGAVPMLQPWSLPEDPPHLPVELARALIGAAVLAPSNWNSQPWRFEADGASIRIVADTQRSLSVTDPDQRGLTLSLGAALENLLVAARAYGLRPKVTYLPFGGTGNVFAEVTWTHGDSRRDRAVFAAITERRTNRKEYDGRGLFPQNRAQLLAQVPDEFQLHWVDDSRRIGRVADLSAQAVRTRTLDSRAQAELYAWTRFDDDARRKGDGVTVGALDLGPPASWLASRYLNPRSVFLGLGARALEKETRSSIRSAGALALLTGTQPSTASWLMGGQTYERIALKATQLGIAHQPINAAIESERHRGDLLSVFGAGAEDPLLLIRFGHAGRPDPSVRRGVSMVTSFRGS